MSKHQIRFGSQPSFCSHLFLKQWCFECWTTLHTKPKLHSVEETALATYYSHSVYYTSTYVCFNVETKKKSYPDIKTK